MMKLIKPEKTQVKWGILTDQCFPQVIHKTFPSTKKTQHKAKDQLRNQKRFMLLMSALNETWENQYSQIFSKKWKWTKKIGLISMNSKPQRKLEAFRLTRSPTTLYFSTLLGMIELKFIIFDSCGIFLLNDSNYKCKHCCNDIVDHCVLNWGSKEHKRWFVIESVHASTNW